MSHTLRITVLGCGSSGGVPRVGGDWGVCDPNNPKNRRSRCSVLVEKWANSDVPLGDDAPEQDKRTIILVDTSPDLREQLLSAKVGRVDALLYTHDHADQSHGIDDMRAIAYRMRQRIPTYMDEHTKTFVFKRFEYCFNMPDGRVHPAILDLQPLFSSGDKFQIDGAGGSICITALGLSHGPTPSFGFKFDDKIVYTPDVWDIADDVLELIESPEVWLVDALRYASHPTHAHADKTLSWLARTKTRLAVLTNLHIDLDYNTLTSELMANQVVAYDGLKLYISVT